MSGSPDRFVPGTKEDAYEYYLDLPAGERPPHYYQLLGLELFCSHPERIKQAARKQFRRIKPNEDHPHRQTRETIQDIMTQIATANVVLTNPEQKDEYDAKLAVTLGIDRDEMLRNRIAAPLPDCELRIVAGPNMINEQIDLIEGSVVTIGHDPQCTVTLESSRMGRLHCQIEQKDDLWLLTQVDQKFPTLVNDQRCTKSLLIDGDTIDMGGYRLRFIHTANPHYTDHHAAPLSLIIRKGPSTAFPVFKSMPGETILIGHCDTALWQLPDSMVSRHHCRVQPAGDHWEVEDLDSTNHTLVNGQAITRSIIENRDEIRIGRFEVLVSLRK